MVFVKTYAAPPYSDKEILRYAGCKEETADMRKLLDECKAEADGVLSYKVCYLQLPVSVEESVCDLGGFVIQSAALAKNLHGCSEAVLFAATVGVGIERLIGKTSRLSPAKALTFDAIGTERVEALCDAFCDEIREASGKCAKPRFSPGYGDFGLGFQKDIFAVLNCRKHIGLSLTESLMMSPSKSVTAIMGLCEAGGEVKGRKCERCEKRDCPFRSIL